ncbi:MAG: hypothetical protein JZU63_07305 [Rhodoferax sp.]|nr:hypothetical protein [Rhodoferax sp.]
MTSFYGVRSLLVVLAGLPTVVAAAEGPMLCFCSPVGVAVAHLFPEGKSVGQWLRHGWYILISYVVDYTALALILGRPPI